MPICPVHKVYRYGGDGECPTCKAQNMYAVSVEFDKQDRVIDTMRVEGWEFDPHDSRAVLVFKKGGDHVAG